MLVDTAQESRLAAILTSFLTFKASDKYAHRLNDIYTDRLVYVHQWLPFMTSCVHDWKQTSYLTLGLLMLHGLFFFTPSSSTLTIASALCLLSSLGTATFLIHRHDELQEATATRALTYLENIRSENFKFQLVALAYALPKALYFWGLSTFSLNFILLVMRTSSVPITAMLVSVCLLAALAFERATSQSEGVWSACSRRLMSLVGNKESVQELPV